MKWFNYLTGSFSDDCGCDVHCSSDSWGCDDDNVCGTDTDD